MYTYIDKQIPNTIIIYVQIFVVIIIVKKQLK